MAGSIITACPGIKMYISKWHANVQCMGSSRMSCMAIFCPISTSLVATTVSNFCQATSYQPQSTISQCQSTKHGQSDCTCVSGHIIKCNTLCSVLELPKQLEELLVSVAKPEPSAAKPEPSAAKSELLIANPHLSVGKYGSSKTDSAVVVGISDARAGKTEPFLPL